MLADAAAHTLHPHHHDGVLNGVRGETLPPLAPQAAGNLPAMVVPRARDVCRGHAHGEPDHRLRLVGAGVPGLVHHGCPPGRRATGTGHRVPAAARSGRPTASPWRCCRWWHSARWQSSSRRSTTRSWTPRASRARCSPGTGSDSSHRGSTSMPWCSSWGERSGRRGSTTVTAARRRGCGETWRLRWARSCPGIGGSFTRFGHVEVLYVTELVGVLFVWIGYTIMSGDGGRSAHAAQRAVATVYAIGTGGCEHEHRSCGAGV